MKPKPKAETEVNATSDCEVRASDYCFSVKDAEWLLGVVSLPCEFRAKLFALYADENGLPSLVNLFAQFVGMAQSVIMNTRETLELLGILEAGMDPYSVEKLNVPSLFGALNGVKFASMVKQDSSLCAGCAFRHGTLANQSGSTTCDVEFVMSGDEERFMCHEELDDNGEPTRPCAGHAQVLKRLGLTVRLENSTK